MELHQRTFICYAREDTEFVFTLAEALINRRRTVLIWLDQLHIRGGTDWDRSIDEALHACLAFLIVLSPAAVASNEVRAELRVALDANKLIIPLLYQPCEIPRQLKLKQIIDMTLPGMTIGHAAKKIENIIYGDE